VFHKLYSSEEWLNGSITGAVVATLDDYLEEYEQYIEPSFFKRHVQPLKHTGMQCVLFGMQNRTFCPYLASR
jgi:hypothetical protein